MWWRTSAVSMVFSDWVLIEGGSRDVRHTIANFRAAAIAKAFILLWSPCESGSCVGETGINMLG